MLKQGIEIGGEKSIAPGTPTACESGPRLQ